MNSLLQRTDKGVYLQFKELKKQGKFATFAEFQRAMYNSWRMQEEIKKSMPKMKLKGFPRWF